MSKGVEEQGESLTQLVKEDEMKHPWRFNIILIAFITLMVLPGVNRDGSAQTKTYPDKSRSLNVIVAYPPGGGTDVAARVMTSLLKRRSACPS